MFTLHRFRSECPDTEFLASSSLLSMRRIFLDRVTASDVLASKWIYPWLSLSSSFLPSYPPQQPRQIKPSKLLFLFFSCLPAFEEDPFTCAEISTRAGTLTSADTPDRTGTSHLRVVPLKQQFPTCTLPSAYSYIRAPPSSQGLL